MKEHPLLRHTSRWVGGIAAAALLASCSCADDPSELPKVAINTTAAPDAPPTTGEPGSTRPAGDGPEGSGAEHAPGSPIGALEVGPPTEGAKLEMTLPPDDTERPPNDRPPPEADEQLEPELAYSFVGLAGEAKVSLGRSKGQWWGRASREYAVGLKPLRELLATPAHFGTVFSRFSKPEKVGDDVYHMVLSLPSPMGDRDMVLRLSVVENPLGHLVHWAPAPDVTVPEGSATRLPDYEVAWTLVPIASDRTRAEISWNSELGLPLPSPFAREAVMHRAAEEMVQVAEGLECSKCHAGG